jgi:DNA-binding transcriptional LysR family regulator
VDVELRQLRSLVAVAEEHSFTAAGHRLHLSQQSVSALVRRLELNLGVKLFDRTTRRVEPTPACETLLPAIKSALGILDGALARTRDTANQERPLRVAFTPAITFGALQDLLEAIGDVGLPAPDVRELWADEIPKALCDGLFDAGIGVELEPVPGLEVKPWRRQRVDLLVPESHPFARLSHVAVAQLGGTTLVVLESTANRVLHEKLAATLMRVGVQPVIVEAPRMSGPAPVAVERGTAVTVWLSGMEERYVPHGLVHVPLREPETMVTTGIATAAEPNPSMRVSIELLREAIDRTREP